MRSRWSARSGISLKGAANTNNSIFPLDDGLVAIDKAELVELASSDSSTPGTPTIGTPLDDTRMDRHIIDNTAKGFAVQINGPVGIDVWRDMAVRIEKNVADGSAVQINYATTREEVRDAREHQLKLMQMNMDMEMARQRNREEERRRKAERKRQ